MTEWLDHLFNDPIRENWWSLALLLILFLTYAGSLVIPQWRDRRVFLRRKKETKMPARDSHDDVQAVVGPLTDPQPAPWPTDRDMPTDGAVQPIDPPAETRPDAEIDAEQERRWREETIPNIEADRELGIEPIEIREISMAQTPFARGAVIGNASVPAPMLSQTREACPHCEGRGYMPGLNDLLGESIALLGGAGDEVIRTFYVALFQQAPDLAALFPGDPREGDLGTDHKGAKQREKLLNAIAALADLYDPSDEAKMKHLDTALAAFGRSHAAFVRRDGTIKGATWEEYAAVKDALFTTLIRTAADAWRPEYSEAWSQAYDYAAGVMLVEQHRSGFAAPRFPRA